MFTPKPVKHARLLLRGVEKFVHFKRDVLKPEKLAEINALRIELGAAVRNRELEKIDTLSLRLHETCDKALPPPSDAGLRDWIDSLVTCAVIVFAIRAYFIQPFKIPTGSMQPTLNGIIATPTPSEAGKPNIARQGFDLVARGRNHVKAVAPVDGFLIGVRQRSIGVFVNYTTLVFRSRDGASKRITVWAPARHLIGQWRPVEGAPETLQFDGLWVDADDIKKGLIAADDRGDVRLAQPLPVRAGQVLAAGTIDSGDMVLVDKVSYHFRRPNRGEVFVFKTRGIQGIEERMDDPREGSQHYIKRLTGVPGDQLEIKNHDLFVNGEPAREKGIRRVIDQSVADISAPGYHGYSWRPGLGPNAMTWMPSTVPSEPARGYFAMGDNSYNSYDSRYWGPVPEENLVGPALFSLWPLTSGHWGIIR